ncbi:hypothetical protein [Paracoccus aminophilus]|uniref:Transmembrane protein n=1 Tax=Paracoccus aminophilus JCM 7686 TaxID=1367847 RepID=S5Y9V9_PARAH|nr:hypothetical protein [Paracoccus aminophilus]AGT08153.1 hypothetical protein JCM7686_1044 [Paracoccus aminophilus JCM 7686]
MRRCLTGFGILLMLLGPLLQGLSGASDPYAYVFAPVMLAGAIPRIALRGMQPDPIRLAIGVVIAGALSMGLWWIGGQLVGDKPWSIAVWVPLTVVILGVLMTVAGSLLRHPEKL